MSSEIAIEIENLTKCYQVYSNPQDRLKQFLMPKLFSLIGKKNKLYHQEFWALNGITLSVKKGEVIGIIGRNGSGKSTLLQIICGTLAQTSGSLRVVGRIAALLELGSGFNPEFSGIDNIYMNAAVLGLTRAEVDLKIEEILAFADIGDFVYQPVKTYSSGMVVRLAFAVASCVDPDILVVDEALAVGDAVFQAKCYQRFKELRNKGVTVLLVTHDIGSVIQLCDRAYVLHKGELVASGMPKEMGDEYRRRCSESSRKNQIAKIENAVMSEVTMPSHKKSKVVQEYGDMQVVISNFGLFNVDDKLTEAVLSGDKVLLRVYLTANNECEDPIVAFSIRDLAGNELAGNNTMYLNSDVGALKPGEQALVEFAFKMPFQPGVYNLCLACTELGTDGIIPHHRLFDVLQIEVAASNSFVGKFDLSPDCVVIRNAE